MGASPLRGRGRHRSGLGTRGSLRTAPRKTIRANIRGPSGDNRRQLDTTSGPPKMPSRRYLDCEQVKSALRKTRAPKLRYKMLTPHEDSAFVVPEMPVLLFAYQWRQV